MKKSLISWIGTLTVLASSVAQAETVTVTVTNLTQGIYFTPLLIAAHAPSSDIFEVGSAASAGLQAMAEGGEIMALESDLMTAGAVLVANPASGLLAPAASTTAMLANVDLATQTRLSIVAMMLPTNDAFIGLDSLAINATTSGTYNINAYDAGTEINNELFVPGAGGAGDIGIPADPGSTTGTGGAGVAAAANGSIHIHPGVLGDTNATGGDSDLDSRVHRWLNPVARVTVTVSN